MQLTFGITTTWLTVVIYHREGRRQFGWVWYRREVAAGKGRQGSCDRRYCPQYENCAPISRSHRDRRLLHLTGTGFHEELRAAVCDDFAIGSGSVARRIAEAG